MQSLLHILCARRGWRSLAGRQLLPTAVQVRWQATQFLLRRLTRELTIMNSTFIRLSVLLPPTRWESRRRRAERKTGHELREPLLESGQHADRQPVMSS